MESSLRNHALVQQQNQQNHQQQHQIRNREEFYRNNGIIRPSSASAAPATSSHHGSSHHGSNGAINTSSQRSRNSGSSTSGKGSRGSNSRSGRSSRSGEGSDEAVQGITEQVPKHRYLNEHQLHQHQHQQQQYYYYQQQQQQEYLHQQRYPQHHPYYSTDGGMVALPQQQGQYVHVFHDGSSSSQHSSSHHQQYIDQHQHQHQYQYGGGPATDGTASTRSHYSNILGAIAGSGASNPSTEEAYRRVGMRLSLSAHGGDSESSRSSIHRARKPPRLGFRSPSSCFKAFEEQGKEKISSTENNSISGKSSKVSITRKMTLNANDLFRFWYTEHSKIRRHQSHRRRRNSNSGSNGRSSSRTSKTERSSGREDITSHQLAFAHMTLSDGRHINSHGHSHSHKQSGSLSAVIESGSQNSSTATRSTTTNSRNPHGNGVSQRGNIKGDGNCSVRSEDKSRASSSIATRSSMGTRNSFLSFGTIPPRGKCLTQPSEGVSNDGLCDNVEGNLIVYENDNISIPKKQVCVLTRDKIPRGAPSSDFRVQSLLGQGTFAQVFRCLHVQTGRLVAVKIVKNKPAYTRQAAVEIDVIRALTVNGNEKANSVKNKNSNSSSSNNKDRSKTNIDVEGPSHNDNFNYMVDMVCYFLYKDHLCLVFELLGLNLYEVLKKRQFRGLPLVVTQTLVRQAVLGVRRLAEKSIVHCDLKPENILLVDYDDSESVLSAGESKRSRTSSKHGSKSSHSSSENNVMNSVKTTDNEDQVLPSSKRKPVSDTDSSKITLKDQDEKTQTGQTHISDNSKSTAETDNTRTMKEQQQHQHQQQKQQKQSSKETKTTTTTLSKSSQEEKSNAIPTSKSPMESTIATYEANEQQPTPICNYQIKLIDFGSACFEGQMSHTYIQSRFYRSPEVLLGLAYDSAIDMWSLGCVAAELFLGLPILPGVHEHDQLGRIIEMIGETPDWMLDQGTKSSKYFVKYVPTATSDPSTTQFQLSSTSSEGRPSSTEASASGRSGSEAPRPLPQWRIKTQQQYIASLSQSDITKKGGLAKLQKQPGNRYFKRKLLSDIILHKGQSGKQEDLRLLKSFIHFLYGILDPDPWKRWTAFQVTSHPFFTGAALQENIDPSKIKDDNQANRLFNLYWEAPSDVTIYRRKLLNVQKTREKQQAARRSFSRGHSHSRSRSASPSRQNRLPVTRNEFSKINDQGDGTHSLTNNTDELINQAGAQLIRQGSFNLPSSRTQFESNQDIRLLSYNSGSHNCSESFNSMGLPGSFNEVDFALALYRPGVVPMGDSVTTSTTSTTSMSSGNNSRSTYNQNNNQTSQVGSFGSHHFLHYNNQQRRLATESLPRTSCSLEQADLNPANAAAIPTTIDSCPQEVLYSSSQGNGTNIGPPIELKADFEVNFDPSTKTKGDNIHERPTSTASTKSKPPPETIQPTTEDDFAPSVTPKSNSETNFVHPNQALGIYDSPQAYQQQLAAMQQHFQEQQILLKQQQAAIALQQEQLRAYYSNISNATGLDLQHLGLMTASATPTPIMNTPQLGAPGPESTPAPNTQNAAGINTQQFGVPGAQVAASNTINSQQLGIPGNSNSAIMPPQFSLSGSTLAPAQAPGLSSQQFELPSTTAPIQGGGYYIVPTADGNHMIVPSSQGIPMSMPAQAQGMPPIPGMLPGQLTGLPTTSSQIQGIGSAGLHTVGVTRGDQGIPMSMPAQAQGMPPIPGILPGQLTGLPTTSSQIQGIGSAGLPTVGVTRGDQGIPMSIPAQAQGMPPITGMLPGQLTGLHTMPSQIQGIGSAGLPTVGVTSGAAVVGMPGIQGMQASGMIAPAGGVQVGMAPIPTTNINSSPTLSGRYPNTNKQ